MRKEKTHNVIVMEVFEDVCSKSALILMKWRLSTELRKIVLVVCCCVTNYHNFNALK